MQATPQTTTYTCRIMHEAEIAIAMDWAAAEGWNPGLHDAQAFAVPDPEGFFLAVQDGLPTATISAVRYNQEFGFIGFYIVRRDLRGQGRGRAIWNQAMAHLRGCCIGLDGVIEQVETYRKSGFTLAHRNIRFGASRPVRQEPAPGTIILDAAKLPPESLAAFDRGCFQAPRDAFLRAWLNLPGHIGRAVVRDGTLAGYAVLRPCRQGSKIGPLFADDEAAARALLTALLSVAPLGPVFLDIPEPNQRAAAIARDAGMAPVFETARMYSAPPPATDVARIYGITSFELG